jgi:hypothetical protein
MEYFPDIESGKIKSQIRTKIRSQGPKEVKRSVHGARQLVVQGGGFRKHILWLRSSILLYILGLRLNLSRLLFLCSRNRQALRATPMLRTFNLAVFASILDTWRDDSDSSHIPEEKALGSTILTDWQS